MAEYLSSAQVQRLTGASRKALRLYEARGFITRPPRSHTGWRRYPPQTVEEVRFIRSALALGLRLEDLRPALEAWRKRQSPCPILAGALQRRLADAEGRLRALTRQYERLKATAEQWDCLCPPGLGVCPQIETVAPESTTI